MIRRPPRSTLSSSSAASDVYKRQGINAEYGGQADNRMESRMELVLRNCHLATMCDGGYTIVTDAALGVRDGRIGWVGKECDLPGSMLEEAEVRDLRGAWVTPGLIDCHSHVVYGGDRAGEWELKLKGASYKAVSYTHLRAHETPEHLVCRLLLEKKKKKKKKQRTSKQIENEKKI
eukprot:TRINITY_DN11339_c0_g1_i3.p2 TRINITY_DN11339_c0_g1~~TRINITY_DN11339_c0_g1_i3.p2  ORF type:complete len:176 (-),score=52.40 TRINITY_DN11339_c0_g1_i3:50-577(-)